MLQRQHSPLPQPHVAPGVSFVPCFLPKEGKKKRENGWIALCVCEVK